MWGSIMDQAKNLASDLDKKLNDSVGMEGDPILATAGATTSSQTVGASAAAAAAAAIIPEETATTAADDGDDNAWNDDFGFDDDNDDDINDADDHNGSGGIEDEKEESAPIPEADPLPTSTSTPTLGPEIPASPPPPVIPESAADPSRDSAPTAEVPSLEELTSLVAVAAVEVEDSVEEDTGETSPIGWDGAEDDIEFDIDKTEAKPEPEPGLEETREQEKIPALEEQPPKESVAPPPSPLPPPPMAPENPEEPFVDIPPANMGADAIPDSQRKDKAKPAFAAAATSMFSSFAQRAEIFAQQAETLVDKAVHAPPGTGTSDTDNMDGSNSNSKSTLLSSIPMGAAEKSEERAVDSANFNVDGGWEGEDDLDLPGDSEHTEDGADDTLFAQRASPESVVVINPEPSVQPVPSINDSPTTVHEESEEQQQEQEQKIPPAGSTPTTILSAPPPMNAPEDMEIPPPTQIAVKEVGALNTPTMTRMEDDPRYQQLLHQLTLRENQLANKSIQLTELQSLMEAQEHDLRRKIMDTKEEAKKRILRSKERCDAAEKKAQSLQSNAGANAASQSQLIQALREEGEKLARKQSAMEQAVRAAKGESRDLAEHVEVERKAKIQALERNARLDSELKSTKDFLSAARKGESQAGKLETDLLGARSDAAMKAATILSLQQQIKELTTEGKELQELLTRSRKSAAQDAKQEKKTLQREHVDVISDLENKLRTTEREAGVREDALRHEVSELRKRWQDAVRRADALSMDAQSSTAPLIRQLESMERQSRARSANWTELENRLRSELEETVIQNEILSKERSEFKSKYTRLERSMKEQEQELSQATRLVEEQTAKITKLEAYVEDKKAEAEKRQEEYVKVERLANEGVMRVRSEMTQTVVDSEERYRGQIDKLEGQLRVETEKRRQLEQQLEQLLENAGMIVAPHTSQAVRLEAKPKRLRQAEGQAEILAGALGFDSDSDDEKDEEILGHSMDRGDEGNDPSRRGNGGMNSFAALEQLTSKLKVSRVELEALRNNLHASEKSRESLAEELGESRSAKEKLPLFEAKVKELTLDNREKELEIMGLQEDIADVRELYRTQLNVLLEEKASSLVLKINTAPPVTSSEHESDGPLPPPSSADDPVFEPVKQG